MPQLEVPGASLHYETFGTGPSLLLLIAGANGRGSDFHPIAKVLASHYQVVCWDRRGYSGSKLLGLQDLPRKREVDADDAALLIQHLTSSANQSSVATVFGTSSGAIVTMTLLLRHPTLIKTAYLHEPPAFGALPAEFRAQGEGLIQHIYDTYRSKGPTSAMEAFTGALSADIPDEGDLMRSAIDVAQSDEVRANSLFWFEFEMRQYPFADVDVAALAKLGDKIVPVAGVESGDGPAVGPITCIAAAVGKVVLRLPGGHVGYLVDPEAWAKALEATMLRN